MGRHSLPLAIAKLNGAATHNPARYESQHLNDSPELGLPPARFSSDENGAWVRFQRELPYLKECHRAFVEMACAFRVQAESGLMKTADMRFYMQILQQLGATPLTEGRVSHGEKVDPGDDFDNL